MTLSQRPSAHFFAAFYRWNCYAQRPIPHVHPTRYRPHSFQQRAQLAASRSFSSARLRRQQNLGGLEEQDDGTLTHLEEVERAYREAEAKIGRRRGEVKVQGSTKEVVPDADLQPVEPVEEPPVVESNFNSSTLQQPVRHLMRHVPSSVAIITAAHVDPRTNRHVPLGIAVSSLNTVTLDPPTISFNVRHPSQTLDAIRAANGRFRVHFLDAQPSAASLVDSFTKGNHSKAFAERQSAANITLLPSPAPPQIQDPTVVGALECAISQELSVADHVIVVAEVSSIESDISEPTLTYVRGNYVWKAGSVQHSQRDLASEASVPSKRSAWRANTHPFWRFPLFPGEAERDVFIDRIKTYLKHNPRILDLPLKEASSELRHPLNVSISCLGISLEHVIGEAREETNRPSDLDPYARGLPTKYKFYGRLSPDDIAQIIETAKTLAKNDLSYLSLHQRKLGLLLGVDPLSFGILASDILDALREDAIVPPFEASEPSQHNDRRDVRLMLPDLETLEQFEYMVRKFLQKHPYEDTVRMGQSELAQLAAGEKTPWVRSYVNLVRPRLQVEVYPEMFDESKCDISGQVTPEEARVVVRRMIELLQSGNSHIGATLKSPWWEILRRVRVHPMITGMDPQFLLGKLKHFLSFHPPLAQLREFIKNMTDPLLKDEIAYNELETVVDNFARDMPLRAITWSRLDILAALGLSRLARVGSPDPTPLITGPILPDLLNAALRKHHGPGAEKEMLPVIQYLANYKPEQDDSLLHPIPLSHTFPARISKGKEPSAYRTFVPNESNELDKVLLELGGVSIRKLGIDRGENAAKVFKSVQKKEWEREKARNESSNLEHKHLNFAGDLKNLEGKSHGFKAYGLQGGRKKQSGDLGL